MRIRTMLLLFMCVVIFMSCETIETSESDSFTDEIYDDIDTKDCHSINLYEYYSFPYRSGVIIEWGDRVTFASGEMLVGDTAKWSISEGEYVGFSVKYIHYFAGTAREPYWYLQHKRRNDFFTYYNCCSHLLDPETREAVLQNYDDVVVINSLYVDMIEKGRTDFVFMDEVHVFPRSISEGKEYPTCVFTPKSFNSDRYGEPILFPIVDGRLVIDDRMYDIYEGEIPLGDSRYYEPYRGEHFEDIQYYNGVIGWAEAINSLLITLDRDEILFRDGITIEEMDSYFDLVCKTSTFRPLETAYDVGITDITPP